MARDPYLVLEISPGASPAEVKRAYRRLAKANHPDSAGEAALPRFLEIQLAYESLAAGKWRPGTGVGRPADVWRADSARARSTPGARSAGSTRRGDPAGGRSTDPSGGARPGPNGPRTRPGAEPRADGPAGRRRAPRKATFGSTSYDEARDPADPAWSGGAWYGQSSGEYWTVNPREYADPRKHGPEYQARAATERARRADRGRSGNEAGDRDGTGRDAAGIRAEAAARRRAGARARAAEAGAAEAGPAEAGAAEAAQGGAAEAAHAARNADGAETRSQSGPAGTAPWPPAALGLGLGRLDGLPFRRGLIALAAWPPLGIAAASVIGEATGCASFSAACTSTATLYPWVAQLAILLAMLLLPAVARILAGGSAAVLLLAFPVAATLSASGANYDRLHGPPSLIGVLAVVWLGGVLLMALQTRRSRRAT